MKLMLHIVRKDLRRLRWYLAAWLAVVAARYAIGYAVIWGGVISGDTFRWLEVVVGAMGASEVIAMFFLTALLVQGDALVGSRQFWLTRPISGWRLLGAKILGAVLLLLAPALALALPWWSVCGFDRKWMAIAALELVAWQLLALVPAFLVASLTDTFGRFVMWSLLLFWLVMMAPYYTQWAAMNWMGSSAREAESLSSERLQVAGVVAVVVVALVVTLQYLTRRWVRSVFVLAGGCLLALGVGTLWVRLTPPVRNLSEVRPEWNGARAAGVKLDLVKTTADTGKAQVAKAGVLVRSFLQASGLPDRVWMTGTTARLICEWSDGTKYESDGYASSSVGRWETLRQAFGGVDPQKDEETLRWLRDHPPRARPSTPVTYSYNGTASVRIPAAIVARMGREPKQLRLKTDFEFLEPKLTLETKLQPGGWTTHAGHGLRVKQVGPVVDNAGRWGPPSAEMQVTVVQSSPQMLIDSPPWFVRFLPAILASEGKWRWWRWYDSLVAVNRGHGTGWANRRNGLGPLRLSSVMLVESTLVVNAPKVVRDGKWVLAHPGWFEGANLAILDWETVARFSREVPVEDFPITK